MSNDFVKSVEPPLPDTHCVDADTGKDVWSYSQDLLIDYANKVADAILAKLAEGAEPVAYLHTMHMDSDQSRSVQTLDEDHPFGRPGIDFSQAYLIETVQLYATPPDAQAQIDAMTASLDANWVTHQRVVTAEKERDALQAELAKRDARIEALEKVIRKYIGALDSWDGSGKAERYTKRCEYDMRAAIAQEQS